MASAIVPTDGITAASRVEAEPMGANSSAHSPDRRVELAEQLLVDHAGHLGTEAGKPGGVVGDDGPAGARHRAQDGLRVEGDQAAQIDHLDVDLLLGHPFGRGQGVPHRPAVGDDGDVAALPFHVGRADRDTRHRRPAPGPMSRRGRRSR